MHTMDAPTGMRAPTPCDQCAGWFSAIDEVRCPACADDVECGHMASIPVNGVCPGCGKRSLVLTDTFDVACTHIGCCDPSAAMMALNNTDHTVLIGERQLSDTVKTVGVVYHPMYCSAGGRVEFDCPYQEPVEKVLAGDDPLQPGRYVVTLHRDDPTAMHWQPIS